MLKGLTVRALVRRTHPVKAGETVLVHAAAGGVGLIMIQWLKALGATVIGTVGSDAKAEIARAPRLRPRDRLHARGRSRSASASSRAAPACPVVYDSVGKATFEGIARLPRAARPHGELRERVGLGARPSTSARSRRRARSSSRGRRSSATWRGARTSRSRRPSCSRWCGSGKVKVEIGRTWPLAEAAEAHRALEARETTGSLVLAALTRGVSALRRAAFAFRPRRGRMLRLFVPRRASLTVPSYVSGTSTVPLLGETIGENLRRTVERFPDREALVVVHQGVPRDLPAVLGGDLARRPRAARPRREEGRPRRHLGAEPLRVGGAAVRDARAWARSSSTSTRRTASTSSSTRSSTPASRRSCSRGRSARADYVGDGARGAAAAARSSSRRS